MIVGAEVVKLLEQPDEIRSTFAFWQVLRSLGFESEVLYVGIVGGRLLVEVRQGGEPYSLSMGRTLMTQEEFGIRWMELSEALPAQDEADLKANYEKWVTRERWESTIEALVMAGVDIPAHRQRLH